MKKILASALAVAVASLVLTGCGGEEKQIVRISHSQIDTHPDHLGAVAFKNYVESKLGDKFEISIYPNATLGANEKVLELIKQGSVQYLVVSTANLESFDKMYSLFSIPYLFTSEAAYEKFITDPAILKQLGVNAKANGFEPVAAFTAGTRNFYAKEPIKSVADLQGKKFRVQAGPVNVAMMQAFGAAATPMSFGDYDMHQMCPDLLVASNSFLSKLTPEERKVFDEAAAEAQKVEFAAWKGSIDAAKQKATEMGVQFINVDVNEFRNKVLPLHEQIIGDTPALKPLYDAATAANNAV